MQTITKQYNNRIHSSTKLTPIQASLKKNESFVYKNLLDKRKKIKPKFQINDLVRVADLKKTFSKGDTTNCSYKLYKITEIINDTRAAYKIDNLKERYNESLLKRTELTLKENDNVMKKSKFKLDRSSVVHHCLKKLICSLKLKRTHISQQECFLKI